MKTRNEYAALKALLSMSGWERRGGHPDAKIARICELLKQAGFRRARGTFSLSPDGYRSYSGDSWRHPLGLEARLSTRYGAVAADNSFHFSVRVIGKGGAR